MTRLVIEGCVANDDIQARDDDTKQHLFSLRVGEYNRGHAQWNIDNLRHPLVEVRVKNHESGEYFSAVVDMRDHCDHTVRIMRDEEAWARLSKDRMWYDFSAA